MKDLILAIHPQLAALGVAVIAVLNGRYGLHLDPHSLWSLVVLAAANYWKHHQDAKLKAGGGNATAK